MKRVCVRGRFDYFKGQEIWHDFEMRKHRRLWDTYRFPGFAPDPEYKGYSVIRRPGFVFLNRRGKKRFAPPAAMSSDHGTIANGGGCAT